MKVIRWSLMAIVMLFACSVQVQAATHKSHKQELKQAIFQGPVMAIEKMQVEVLKTVEIGVNCLKISFHNKQLFNPVSLMVNRCDRITRADYFTLSKVRRQILKRNTFILKKDPASVFRSIPLLC